jgi:hypothetical protein
MAPFPTVTTLYRKPDSVVMKPSSLAVDDVVSALISSIFAAIVEDGVDKNAILLLVPTAPMVPVIVWERNVRRSGLLAEYATADPTNNPDASRTVYLRFILALAY